MKPIEKLICKYNNLQQGIRASTWFLFANIFQKAVMVIFTPIFTRILSPEEFSKFATFQSWETIITVFATLSVSNYATAKALVEYKEDRDKFIASAISLTATLTCITFVICQGFRLVFGFLGEFPLWITVLLFVDILFTAVFAFWSQVERFELKYRALVVASIITGIASPVIAFILISFADKLSLYPGWARVIGLAGTNTVLGVVLLVICLKKAKVIFSVKYWKFCVLYCLPLVPHFLAMAFLQRIGQLFVDHYCGPDAAGIYSLANSLAMLMMVVNDAFTKTLVPWTYTKLSEEKYEEINKPIILALGVIGIADIVLALIAPEVVAIFADKNYSSAVYAVSPLVAVCFFGFLYNTFANIEYYYKENLFVSVASIIAGITITLLDFILVPRFGIFAAAYTALISYIIYAFMKRAMNRHIPGVKIYNCSAILKLSIVFVVVILLMPVLYRFTILRYVLILTGCILMIIKRKFLMQMLKKIFAKKA